MTAASRSLATALRRARFASGLPLPSYTTRRDTTDLVGFRRQPERLGRDLQKPGGIAEVQPRLVLRWLEHRDAVM
jgi:hypothetical protein